MIQIKLNKAQCLKCNDIIESKYRHDFVKCKCGAIFVDGGIDYLRRGGNLEHILDLSETEELDMPLKTGKDNIGNNIKTEEKAGKPFNQAKAIALSKAYGPAKKPTRPKPMRKPTGRG